MRPSRLQLALVYCLGQLACADAHDPDDGISYHPKVGGPIVEFPVPRGGPIDDETSDWVQSGADAGVPPPAVMVSPAGGGRNEGAGSTSGGAGTGGIAGGTAGGLGGPGGGTTGGDTTGGLGGFAGGSGGGPVSAPPACDAGALPADAGAVDAGAGGEAGPGCAADAGVDDAAVAPDPAP